MTWPLATLALLTLLAVRVCLAAPGTGEGRLAADGYLAATAGDLPEPALLPRGLGSLLVAGYSELTGAFRRHDSLAGLGREVVAVAVLCAAVLLWRAGRRLGLPQAATGVAVLALGLPLLLAVGAVDDQPAVLALPWLLAAGWLIAPGRVTPPAALLAVALAVPGVLLAPAALLVLTSGSAVLLLDRRAGGGRAASGPLRGRAAVIAVALLLAAFVAVAAALPRWDGEPWPGAGGGSALTAAVVVLLVGALAAWRLPRRRALATAAVATATADLALTGPPAPLVVALPIAALLAAELLAAGARAALRRAPAPAVGRLVAGGTAAVVLAAAGAAVFLLPLPGSGTAVATGAAAGSTERPAGTSASAAPTGRGPAARAAQVLAGWVADELPRDAQLVGDRRLVADLRHAGLPAGVVSDRGAGSGGRSAPFLVTDGAVPTGGRVIGRIERSSDRPLLVVDPAPGTPTGDQRQQRRALSAALLANPTTRADESVRAVLRASDVDPRPLGILAALAARSGVGIGALPPAPHSPADGLLVRDVLIDSVGGRPVGRGEPATGDLVRLLKAQLPPYAPDRVDVTDRGVLIGYRYASNPDALVAAATQ